MALDFDNVLACLAVGPVGDSRYEGPNIELDYRRVFGGQILAQTIAALAQACPTKQVKSFTQLFPREGDTSMLMTYAVDVQQEGRTFATCAVVADQGDAGKVISTTTASLHTPETGLEAQIVMSEYGTPQEATPTDLGMIPWECRVVGGTDLATTESRPQKYAFWTKTPPVTLEGQWVHQALISYATDLTIIGTALLPIEGYSQADTGIRLHTAVTSHTMWFHSDFRVDDWLLVSQYSPVLTGGRAFGRGDVWTQDGRLVASFAQESMVRLLNQES